MYWELDGDAQWREYHPAQQAGKIASVLCCSRTGLPVRDVFGDQGKGVKPGPNYETATYNNCARCNQRYLAPAVRDRFSHIFFLTRYTGTNTQYRDGYFIVGYYEIGQVIGEDWHHAVRAKRMAFVPINKAYENLANAPSKSEPIQILSKDSNPDWRMHGRTSKREIMALSSLPGATATNRPQQSVPWMNGNGVASFHPPSAFSVAFSSPATAASSVPVVTVEEYQPRRVLISVLFTLAARKSYD